MCITYKQKRKEKKRNDKKKLLGQISFPVFKSYRKSVDIKSKAICEKIIDVSKRKCEREMERMCLSSSSRLL